MTPQERVELLELQAKVKRDRIRGYYIKKRYGLTLDQYNFQYEIQAGACRVCGDVKDDLHVYAVPNTTTCAGLLCNRCTLAIGYLKHDAKLIVRASQFVDYSLQLLTPTESTDTATE